jgi:hypothetical protein
LAVKGIQFPHRQQPKQSAQRDSTLHPNPHFLLPDTDWKVNRKQGGCLKERIMMNGDNQEKRIKKTRKNTGDPIFIPFLRAWNSDTSL